MPEDANARLALMLARGFHAVTAPMLAALAEEEGPGDEDEIAAAWRGLDVNNRIQFIDMASEFVVYLREEGLVPSDWEWGYEYKGSTLDGDYDRLITHDGDGHVFDEAQALSDFRSMEMMYPGENFARLVRRGVTEWKQVIDDGS